MQKFYFLLLSFLLLFIVQPGVTQSRKIIHIPDIPGYQTLKGDFHMHTVFSDGTVWPTVRVEEAWREGLDVIAITDHIEYLPHSKDVVADHNRSFEVAKPLADKLGILLIQSAEITRSMPPGHLNVLFISNANLLERDDVFDALKEARDQGAFIFWNHPGWKAQQPDTTLWWEEHTRLLNQDLLHGIEVYNEKEYYREAIDWAVKKDLTMLGNTDIHGPVAMDYDLEKYHRPMTLVFAKSKTRQGVKDALFSQRTAVYFENMLMGKPTILEPLFFASLSIDSAPLNLTKGEARFVEVENNSDVDYELELVQPGVGFDAPETIMLKAHHATPVELRGNSDELAAMDELKAYYKVKNMHVGADENLVVTFSFTNK